MSGRYRSGGRKLTRRELLATVLSAGRAPREDDAEVPGRFRLDSLGDLPDTILLRMIPVIRHAWSAEFDDGGVTCREEGGGTRFVRLEPDGCAAARLFDGVITLEEAARKLEEDLQLSAGSGVAVVREAFLRLAESEAYHPAGPPEETPK